MTRLRWTTPANDDFIGIVEWIKARNPQAAARVGRRILDAVEDLGLFDAPHSGANDGYAPVGAFRCSP